ncbi:GNAT family N-acetyltransferase [Subtercola endophyticus]|uniref:GNAT family N-acetyltransferase n=1 Tax=Subtercola endophyticus TaxID=2895559 RepID=UPI001E43AF8E|nr:GNAT family N-acetyltransferase [Subtercola endophyticus]UFS58513.1 GNAT family N-acetyltransferase [Subtercola endophyticus]
MRLADIIVRPTTAEDWVDVRALRLEMLADTPIAFGDTLESAKLQGEQYWRERGGRGTTGTGANLAAIDTAAGDRWVGTMGGYIDRTAGPMLVGVYVSPDYRGTERGVTDALMQGIEEWARGHSSTLTLHVHSQNARAIAAYERRGYVATGRLFPYILNPHQREMEMRKPL